MELEFRPRTVPTVIAALATLALLGLGTWQVLRYFEKAAMEDARYSRANDPPLEVGTLAELDDPENEYRVVEVTGRLDTERRAVFQFRNMNRRAGCWLASPLLLEGGGVVLANRGWIPATDGVRCDATDLRTPPAERWTGLVHVPDRVLQDVEARERGEAGDQWGTFDVDGVYAAWGVKKRPERPVVMVLDERHSGDPYPTAAINLTENPYLTSATHLSYAFTWYGLIVFVAILWAILSARRVDETR